MNKLIILFLLLVSSATCFSQTAEELLKQSKQFMDKKDFKNAFHVLKKAAEMGNAEGQFGFGLFYENAITVAQDDSVANKWFMKAARQGHAQAQYKIAYAYQMGKGIDKDIHKSFEWSMKCAQQNHPECMFNIVGCYVEGLGVEKNKDSVLYWAIRLASFENPETPSESMKITSARGNLALMYQDGKIVEKDLVKSYMWYLIFNEKKSDLVLGDQQKNIALIKELEKGLSQADKDKAKQDAEKQIGRKLTNLANLYKQDL